MKHKVRKTTVLYALAAALVAGGIVNVAPSTATSSEAVFYINNLAVKSSRFDNQQWGYKRTLGSSTPYASYKHWGWDYTAGIYTFSLGLRNTSGYQFARTQITQPTSNFGADYTFLAGSTYHLPAVSFYLNSRWDKAGGGSPAQRTFYGELHWHGP